MNKFKGGYGAFLQKICHFFAGVVYAMLEFLPDEA